MIYVEQRAVLVGGEYQSHGLLRADLDRAETMLTEGPIDLAFVLGVIRKARQDETQRLEWESKSIKDQCLGCGCLLFHYEFCPTMKEKSANGN